MALQKRLATDQFTANRGNYLSLPTLFSPLLCYSTLELGRPCDVKSPAASLPPPFAGLAGRSGRGRGVCPCIVVGWYVFGFLPISSFSPDDASDVWRVVVPFPCWFPWRKLELGKDLAEALTISSRVGQDGIKLRFFSGFAGRGRGGRWRILLEGGDRCALVFPSPCPGAALWQLVGRLRLPFWLWLEAALTGWRKLGDGSPPMVVQRRQIPAAAPDGFCGTSTQLCCYRAPASSGYVVTSRSSSLATLRRRWGWLATSGVVVQCEELQGPRCNFHFLQGSSRFFLGQVCLGMVLECACVSWLCTFC